MCECNNDDGNDDDGDDDDGDDDDIVGDLHFLVLVELLVRHDGGGGVVGGLQQDRHGHHVFRYLSKQVITIRTPSTVKGNKSLNLFWSK